MDLQRVTAELRPRSAWEAVELGARMIRRDAAVIYRVWFALTLPAILLVAAITLWTAWGWLAMLVYWWLEPLTDGPILRIISRRLFGEAPTARESLRAAPAVAWQNRRFWLTPFRLHFARSALLPVTQLEGLSGQKRRQRARTLGLRIFNHGMGVTAVYHHMVLVVYLGLFLIAYFLMPESVRFQLGGAWFDMLASESRVSTLISLLLAYVAQTLLHPWWVGAGFGLYINCRTALEAWDVELAFRRMARRRRAASVALITIAVLLLHAAPGMAEETDAPIHGYWSDDSVREALDDVYQQDELKTTRETEGFARLDRFDIEPEPDNDSRPFEAFRFIGEALAALIELSLWIVAGIVLLIIFATRDRWLPYLRRDVGRRSERRRVLLADGEVRAEDLPEDLAGSVQSLWDQGQRREALGLLYRGSVFAAVQQLDLDLPPSATENVCLRAVAERPNAELSRLFDGVVSAWVQCAYADRYIDDQRLASLCRDWPQHFGVRA